MRGRSGAGPHTDDTSLRADPTSTFRFNLVNRNHIRYLLTLRTWRSSGEIRSPPNDHVVMTTPTQRLHAAQQLYDNWFLGLWRPSGRLWAKRLVLPPSQKRFYRTYLLFLTGYYYKILRGIVKSEYKCWVGSARRKRGPLIGPELSEVHHTSVIFH